MIHQGDVWWADLPEPVGSGPGYRRPVVIVQGDSHNRSLLATVVCVPLTGEPRWQHVPGRVLLSLDETGLPKASVAQTTQVITIDRDLLLERQSRLPEDALRRILAGLDLVLGR